MNRAFLIILAPALLVAATYLGFGWGYAVSLPFGVAACVVIGLAFLFRRRSLGSETQPRSPESKV